MAGAPAVRRTIPLSLTFERIGQVEIDVYVEEPN